jgi:hypothetical protein
LAGKSGGVYGRFGWVISENENLRFQNYFIVGRKKQNNI